MAEGLDLRKLEKKAFRSQFEDGLWDLFIGLYVLSNAFIPFVPDPDKTDWGAAVILFPVSIVGMIAVGLGKRHITSPRLGIVKYGRKRKASLLKISCMLAFTAALGVVVYFLAEARPDLFKSGPLMGSTIFAFVCLIGSSVMGYVMDFWRLSVYGALYGFSPLAGRLLAMFAGVSHFGYTVSFGVAGSIILVVGGIILRRFLHRYPVETGAAEHGEA